MQYILTEEEYNELKSIQKRNLLSDVKKLQELCTHICDNMSIKWGWSKDEVAKPWGCILTRKDESYCDCCPVKRICPHPSKRYSK